MRKKISLFTKYWMINFVFLILLTSIGNPISIQASSATIYFSSESSQVIIGDTISVVMTVESSAIVGTVEAYVIYDPKLLEFKTGGSLVSGGDGLLKVSDVDTTQENEVKTYSFSFKALKEGSCEIGLSDIPMVCDSNGEEMSYSSNRVSLTVKKTDKSTNNKLLSLEIMPGELVPEFQSDVLEYDVIVESDTKKIFYSTITGDEEATVEVAGNEDLQYGENKMVIKVTAPSKDEREYIIHVNRPAQKLQETVSPEEDQADEKMETVPSSTPIEQNDITGFAVYEEDDKIYLKNEYSFEIKMPSDSVKIPNGYISTTLLLYGIHVPAYTLENDLENDFLLLYAQNENGEEGFYQYDRKEKSLQRYEEISTTVSSSVQSGKITTAEHYNQRVEQLSIIIAILSGICILLSIGIIRLYLKQRGYQEDDL